MFQFKYSVVVPVELLQEVPVWTLEEYLGRDHYQDISLGRLGEESEEGRDNWDEHGCELEYRIEGFLFASLFLEVSDTRNQSKNLILCNVQIWIGVVCTDEIVNLMFVVVVYVDIELFSENFQLFFDSLPFSYMFF